MVIFSLSLSLLFFCRLVLFSSFVLSASTGTTKPGTACYNLRTELRNLLSAAVSELVPTIKTTTGSHGHSLVSNDHRHNGTALSSETNSNFIFYLFPFCPRMLLLATSEAFRGFCQMDPAALHEELKVIKWVRSHHHPTSPPFFQKADLRLSNIIFHIHLSGLSLSLCNAKVSPSKSANQRSRLRSAPAFHQSGPQLACVMSRLEHEHGSIRPLLKFPLLSLTLSLSRSL